MATDFRTILVNKRMSTGQRPGDLVRVEFRKGDPKDRFWRRRLKDAETDRCCEILEEAPQATSGFVAVEE